MTQPIGIVGLGIMGGAFASNLLRAGHAVVGHDIAADARARFEAGGGRALASATEVVRAAAVTFVSLPTVKAFESVYAEVARAGAAGHVLVDTCTMPLEAKQAAAAALDGSGSILLDCPVSGTGAQAAKKDLVVFGSGDAQAFERARPALEGMSRKQVYLGAFGRGSVMKFLANHLVNIHNVAAAEALTLAGKAGMDLGLVYDTLQDSAGTSRMFQIRGPLMVADRYDEPTARVDLFMKDLAIIGAFADSLHCPVPLFSASTALYHAAMSQGRAADDTAVVCRVLEGLAGVRRAPAPSR
ncbi:MAG: NAD(P)-dependent oxidoreductase [Burkholderiales bacterium]|nr:NAD(P)-dependent oxidoreductase [Burkholderiales bacterium]